MEIKRLGATDLHVSRLGFGASSFGGAFGAVASAEAHRTVHTALELGINYFDVSPYYGETVAETVLGNILRDIPRDRYLLSTKAGRYGTADFDFSAARVTRSVDESLARLHCGHIDLLLCHDIEFGDLNQIVNETLPALRRVQEQGKIRAVGISGLPLAIFRRVLSQTELDAVLSYCHYTLFDTTLVSLFALVSEKKTGLINAAPLSMGLLTVRGAPDWHAAGPEIRAACARAAAHCRSRGADIAQIAMQFSAACPQMDVTLFGTPSADELRRNVAWAQTEPDAELLREVQAILQPVHNRTWASGRPENNG